MNTGDFEERFTNVDDVFVIKNNKNKGYANGSNFGVKYVEQRFNNCKYIAIMNPDVEFFEETNLERILDKLESEVKLKYQHHCIMAYCTPLSGHQQGIPDYY